MKDFDYNLFLTIVSAFVGALTGVSCVVWWLAKQFANVDAKIDGHETKNVERYNDLKMKILEIQMQTQTLEALKHKL